MKKSGTASKRIRKYEALHRYLGGIGIFCFFITVIGSASAGTQIAVIAIRGGLFLGCYLVGWWALVTLWRSWEDIRDNASGM